MIATGADITTTTTVAMMATVVIAGIVIDAGAAGRLVTQAALGGRFLFV